MYFLLYFLFPLNINSLICPIYNLFNNETTTCDINPLLCTYIKTESKHRRCLGIYTFDKSFERNKNFIHIRQLGIVDDYENKYLNSTECILEIDRIGNHLLCRCNTNNCTLKWKINQNFHNKFSQKLNQKYNNWFIILIIIFIVITINIIIFLIIINYYCWNKKRKDSESYLATISSISTNISHTDIDEFLTTNSIIHRGKINTIYRGLITGKGNFQEEKLSIAIKLYHGQQYKNIFDNEIQILKIIHHENIINFISHGWHGLSPYIIFEYYDYGSLNNYLRSNKFSWSICYTFLYSLIDAIDYLHYEDLSTNIYLMSNRIQKPIIIHRDIKSSNILIKSYPKLCLCLSDFGLAKVLSPVLKPNDFIQIGTYRYMAPELIELAITHTSDALCKVDMYALGLVMWEIVTQCQEYPCNVDYQLPYEEYINANETNENKILEILHRVIIHERKRPIIHRTATMNTKISDVLTIVEDCWKHEPDSRINARPALYRLRRLE